MLRQTHDATVLRLVEDLLKVFTYAKAAQKRCHDELWWVVEPNPRVREVVLLQ